MPGEHHHERREEDCGSPSLDQLLKGLLIRELGALRQMPTRQDLHQLEERIMNKFSEAAQRMNEHNARTGAAIDKLVVTQGKLVTSQAGIAGDIVDLKEQITALQNTPNGWTEEDQAKLDTMEADAAALATKAETFSTALEGVAEALTALDNMTPPKLPVEDPPVDPPAEPQPEGFSRGRGR